MGLQQPVDVQIDLPGISLHALTWGTPGQPPVVLLHGFMDHAHSWDFVASELAAKHYVIALDFRGHGDSGRQADGGYLFVQYLLDVAGLWSHFNLTSAVVVGHSMGGNVAALYSGTYPERVTKLVLVEGFGPPNRDLSEFPQRTRTWLDSLVTGVERKHPRLLNEISEAADRMQESNTFLSEDRAAHLSKFAVRPVDGKFEWKFDPAHRLPSPHPYREEEFIPFWNRITAPVLAVHGAEGPLSIEAVAPRYAHIKNLKTATIAKAGHNIHIEAPEALTAAVREFIDG